MKYIITLILFISVATAFSHPKKLSFTKIEKIDSCNCVEVLTALFIDDLEVVLQKEKNDSTITLKADPERFKNLAVKYVLNHLQLQANEKDLKLKYYQVAVEEMVIHVQLKAPWKAKKEIKKIGATNTIFIDEFDKQLNKVLFKTGDDSLERIVLDKDKTQGIIQL